MILTLILLMGLFFIGCGGGSSGGDNVDPATGDTWDKMEWDKGTWG